MISELFQGRLLNILRGDSFSSISYGNKPYMQKYNIILLYIFSRVCSALSKLM